MWKQFRLEVGQFRGEIGLNYKLTCLEKVPCSTFYLYEHIITNYYLLTVTRDNCIWLPPNESREFQPNFVHLEELFSDVHYKSSDLDEV